MPLTLDDTYNLITLPEDLQWIDEYSWNTIRQDLQRTLGGDLIISENQVTTGRPITLESGPDVWTTRAVVDELVAMLENAGRDMILTLPDARTFDVRFRRNGEASPIEVAPVLRKRVQESTDYYTVTINLLEI